MNLFTLIPWFLIFVCGVFIIVKMIKLIKSRKDKPEQSNSNINQISGTDKERLAQYVENNNLYVQNKVIFLKIAKKIKYKHAHLLGLLFAEIMVLAIGYVLLGYIPTSQSFSVATLIVAAVSMSLPIYMSFCLFDKNLDLTFAELSRYKHHFQIFLALQGKKFFKSVRFVTFIIATVVSGGVLFYFIKPIIYSSFFTIFWQKEWAFYLFVGILLFLLLIFVICKLVGVIVFNKKKSQMQTAKPDIVQVRNKMGLNFAYYTFYTGEEDVLRKSRIPWDNVKDKELVIYFDENNPGRSILDVSIKYEIIKYVFYSVLIVAAICVCGAFAFGLI